MKKSKVAIISGELVGYLAAYRLKEYGVDLFFFEKGRFRRFRIKIFDSKQANAKKILVGVDHFFLKEKINVISERLVEVSKLDDNFVLKTTKGLYSAEYIILIEGYIPKKLINFEAEKVITVNSDDILNIEKLPESFSKIIEASSLQKQW